MQITGKKALLSSTTCPYVQHGNYIVYNDNVAACVTDIAIEEMHCDSDKLRWMREFSNAYTDGLRPIGHWIYEDKLRYFVIKVMGKQAGFLAIFHANYPLFTERLKMQDVWRAEMAYIKPKYRGAGLLRKLLTYVMDTEGVGLLSIETWRYMAFRDYYVSLGFNTPMYFGDTLLCVMHNDLHEATLKVCPDMGGAKKIQIAA